MCVSSAKYFRPSRSAQDSRYIVIKCEAHQQEQRKYANLLPDNLRPIGQRAAFHPFRNLVHDLPAIQDRNRQQVEDAQTDADENQKIDKIELKELK